MNEVVLALGQLPGLISIVKCRIILMSVFFTSDEFFVYHRDEFDDKYKCFDYNELVASREIDDNLCIDVGIIPNLIYNIPMRDHFDINGIWTGTAKVLGSQTFDCD